MTLLALFKSFNISAPMQALLGVLAMLFMLAYFVRLRITKNTAISHGTSCFAPAKSARVFSDTQDVSQNIILSKHVSLSVAPQKNFLYQRNNNVLVLGGSGAGKTYCFVTPNLCQMYSDYVITDPKKSTYNTCASMLESHGYETVLLDLLSFRESRHYNPLAYVHTDAEILSFTTMLISATTPKDKTGGDPFWDKAERMLYCALLCFMRDYLSKDDYNLPTLCRLVGYAYKEKSVAVLDRLFSEIETGKRKLKGRKEVDSQLFNFSLALRAGDADLVRHDKALAYWRAFKVAADKTMQSILISSHTRLAPFQISEVERILKGTCELKLDAFGNADKRRALFICSSDTDPTYDFLISICVWQMSYVLCNKALSCHKEKLDSQVMFILDEFANLGKLPEFQRMIAVFRSRNIALAPILQSLSQLESIYGKEDAQTIISNCDSWLILGGLRSEVAEEISKALGTSTIFTESISNNTSTVSAQSRSLMDASEITRLPKDECLVLISGTQPIRDKKFNLRTHKHASECL